jgi:hypothetical protein
MKNILFCCFVFAVGIISSPLISQTKPEYKIILTDNWTIQSSDSVKENGRVISSPGWMAGKWYPSTMHSTVLAALVQNKVYPDPYFGTNIQSLPGYFTQRRGEMPVIQIEGWNIMRTEF